MIRLLIADDAPFIREIIKSAFNNSTVSVVGEARDGVEAVEQALKLKPDVILMDIVMPRKSGIDATKEILAQLPETHIIACTTLDQSTMVMKALEAGCRHYITKPFKAAEVVNAVKGIKKKENHV